MDDILRDFVIETTEAIDVVDAELVRFEQEPNNGAVLAQIFRLVHTVKGTCGFLGLPRLEALAHAAETVIGQFRDGVPVTTAAVSLILSTIDRIKLIIGELERNESEPEGEDAALIAKLEGMARQHIEKKTALVSVPEHTTGSLVYQVLERQLRPGEVSLDDLELAFRDAPGPKKSHNDRMSEMFAAADKARDGFDAPRTGFANPASDADFALFERVFDVDTRQTGDEVSAAPTQDRPDGAAAIDRCQADARQDKPPKDTSHEEKPPEEKPVNSGESAASRQTLRVAIDTIDHLMTMVSELVLTRNQLLGIARRQGEGQFKIPLQRLSSITAELQEAVMKTRMQPIAAAWVKLPRLVRDLSVELKKQIELETSGAETEIDRHVLELIRDPLVHMIRNAADHGLEMPEARVAAGKPRAGKIRVSALQEGGYIILEVSDDGQGLNLDRVAQRALTMGLATEEQLKRMSDQDVARFVFHAGFSTAKVVTSVSGRGVGMDVVNTNVEQIGGSIDIDSKVGAGTTISIKIPVTLAIASALVVEAGGQRFAIPQLSVVELVRTGAASNVVIDTVNGSTVLRLRDELLPIASLSTILRLTSAEESVGRDFIVVCQVADRRFGLIVDSVVQTEEIVVKPTSSILHALTTYSGVTILGDGAVVMILDPGGLGRELGVFAERREERREIRQSSEDTEPTTSLLVFRSGEHGLKAVPLELVTRLEEIESAKIETSGSQSLIQYRGKLLPLIAANSNGIDRAARSHHVLVFARGQRSAGLVVDQIIDIVQRAGWRFSAVSDTPGLLGSAIIGGRATEIIDVAHYLPFDMDGREREQAIKAPAILIVDDSGFFRSMLAPVVKAAGFRVFLAADALAALRIVAETEIDAAIVDIAMPGVSGFEFATRLRLEKSGAGIPLIGLAERGDAATVRTARERGFADLVGKFDRQGLVASLNELFHAVEEAA